MLLCWGCFSSPPPRRFVLRKQRHSLPDAGSTFVYPIMTRWVSSFQQTNPGVQINYQSIGSGGGIQQLKNGLVDFGASDVALTDHQLTEMPPVVQIPESAGPVCITYNLPNLCQAAAPFRRYFSGNISRKYQELE